MNDDGDGWDLSPDTLRLSAVHFNVGKSIDGQYHVNVKKFSNGRTVDEAQERASQIHYPVYSKDSILDLANGFAIASETKYRGQQVQIEILIPVGKMIRFDESVRRKLHPFGFRVPKSDRNNYVDFDDWGDYYRYRMLPNIDYTMDENGNLRDESGRILNRYGRDSYRSRTQRRSIDSNRQTRPERKDTSHETMEDQEELGSASIGSPIPMTLFQWN